jgi:hypothetical protein
VARAGHLGIAACASGRWPRDRYSVGQMTLCVDRSQ